MSALGWIHTIFALVALASGSGVIFMRKGGRWHRTIGHFYLSSMLALNFTGLFIFNLYGGFGPFHWMAVISLITLLVGMLPVLIRWPKKQWLTLHGAFMNGSYVGLLAATAAEITSRLPLAEGRFGLVVGVTTAAVILIGVIVIHLTIEGSIGRTPARFKRA